MRPANEMGAGSTSLRGLPVTFSYSQAVNAGLSRWQLYRLRDEGLIESIGRGLYRRQNASAVDIDLVEIARRAPSAILCLTTALARHGLTDEIPSRIDVALPRGRHRPVTSAPVTWHSFAPATFEIGRTELALDEETSIGLYSPERSIIDAIRLRHQEGPELAYTALRRWLRRRGASPTELLAMARQFPNSERALREALEILL
ncbi:MAG TPA: type IV toxin-antitoxin system AbiEi family antitoxin domain-containing protein [Micromonosporaceae bacterium]|nr:type IV toxin-antitoxin system AbiEi family antitoxin domain-containing protein [Micromonosporaceae bacterium]